MIKLTRQQGRTELYEIVKTNGGRRSMWLTISSQTGVGSDKTIGKTGKLI